jgi:hypothetical protein
VYDYPQVLQELVSTLDSEVFDFLYDLCDAFILLHALSQMDEPPESGADPYPSPVGSDEDTRL